MKPELKKLLLLNLPYLLFVYLFAKCGQAYRLAAGADASAKLLHLTSGISAAFASPLPSLHPFDLCVGVVGAVAVRLIVYSKGKNAKKYRKGEEYGSARWGTAKDIAPYIDPKFENNILLTQTERLTMTGRPKDPKTARNKNVLVIGGSGSGKTRFYVKPNLMQCFPTSDYQSDFAYDIKMLREAARSDQPEDKLLLWLSRPSGTFCFRERDVLLKDTQAYNTWKFCGEQTHDRILAYAVELTGAANGTVQGNLYELDYQQHFQHIRDAALPVGANRLIYESGMREIGLKEHFNSRSDKYFGEFVRYEMQPRDPELLQAAIRQEQRSREPARPGDFKEHLAALHTGLIEAEAQRIAANMKRLAAPNSPDKNHFMVEVSPYFTKLASSRDTDQLLAMLPYKSLYLSSVKDRFGIYALVGKNENRDRGICKPRTSVRKQLSETKQAASPKKAAARSKQHEMEV